MNTNKLLDELYDLIPYNEVMSRKDYHRAEEIIALLRVKEEEK